MTPRGGPADTVARHAPVLPDGTGSAGCVLVVLDSLRAAPVAFARAAESAGRAGCTVVARPTGLCWNTAFASCAAPVPFPDQLSLCRLTAADLQQRIARDGRLHDAEVLVTAGSLEATVTGLLRDRDHHLVIIATHRRHLPRRAKRVAATAARFCAVEVVVCDRMSRQSGHSLRRVSDAI